MRRRRYGSQVTVSTIEIEDLPFSPVERQERLVKLGADKLADALLELAGRNKSAAEMIARLLSDPEENFARFRKKLDALSNMSGFIDYDETKSFATELESLLSDLKAGAKNPKIGLELVSSFFEKDGDILESCEDHDGDIQDVFTIHAYELFWHFATQCADYDSVVDCLLKLIGNDNFGVRCGLFDVPETAPRAIVDILKTKLWKQVESSPNQEHRKHGIRDIQRIARKTRDAELYEKCAWLLSQEISEQDKCKIAEVYLEAGDAATALEWMERIPKGKAKNDIWDYDTLMFKIHQRLGNNKEASKIALNEFRQYRSTHAFEKLLSVIGEDQRERLTDEEAAIIHQSKGFSPEDAAFLVENKRLQDAEEYVLKRAKYLDGDRYYSLVQIAEALQADERHIAATLVYRALLDSILNRAQSRAYHHGADYLKALESMSALIQRWEGIVPHAGYIGELRISHGRKYGFWNQFRK
ncbi:MAG: hypothetical protein K2X27_25255 [Candidatus Obscuribacterales bacterium]|nr:hypothetical protein [Candidatus Obscuribacterales bacterium]